jgi:methyl-accepting chemotaxis protein
MTQQNAALVQEAAAAAESLRTQSVQLAEAVARFHVGAPQGGVVAPRRPAPARQPTAGAGRIPAPACAK